MGPNRHASTAKVRMSDEQLSKDCDVIGLFFGDRTIRRDHTLDRVQEELPMGTWNRSGIEAFKAWGHVEPTMDLKFLGGVEVKTANQTADKGSLLWLDLQISPGKRTHKTHQPQTLRSCQLIDHAESIAAGYRLAV